MGEVYRARDSRLDRTVAIKVLPSHHSSDSALRRRFEREARTISKFSHPNICTLHGVGTHDGLDYLVMEYIEGETLEQRLTKGPVPPQQALAYGIQIADALDKAHRSGAEPRSGRMASAVTVSGIQVLSITWKSAGGTASQNIVTNDRITSSYFSHCCCSSPHAAEI
jgi:serine/threonine protein kinase